MIGQLTWKKHVLLAIGLGIAAGFLLALFSVMDLFGNLALTIRGVVGVVFSIILSIMFIPIIQTKIGVIRGKEKLEFVLVSLISTLIFWPIIYSMIAT